MDGRCIGVIWIEMGMAFGYIVGVTCWHQEYNLESYADDINRSSCFDLAKVQMIHHFPTISGTTSCKFISKDAGAEFDGLEIRALLSCHRFLQGGRLPVLGAKFDNRVDGTGQLILLPMGRWGHITIALRNPEVLDDYWSRMVTHKQRYKT